MTSQWVYFIIWQGTSLRQSGLIPIEDIGMLLASLSDNQSLEWGTLH